MNLEANERTVHVQLPATLIEALLSMHTALEANLVGVLRSSVADNQQSRSGERLVKNSNGTLLPHGKYSAVFLGAPVIASTLPEIFAKIVDMTAEVAPEALQKLSQACARKRRFIASRPEAVIPSNPDLPVMQTTSGWWISKNIGQEDMKRSLRALCDAAGLTFGTDVTFASSASLR